MSTNLINSRPNNLSTGLGIMSWSLPIAILLGLFIPPDQWNPVTVGVISLPWVIGIFYALWPDKKQKQETYPVIHGNPGEYQE